MFKNRYSFTSDTATSTITGNEGCVLIGWSLSLPEQAHQLILESTPDAIKEEKKFFLPYERHLPVDKLLADLRFSKSIGLIPIYFDTLPISERVHAIGTVSIAIPASVDENLVSESRKIKLSFLKLNSIKKEAIIEHLNNIKYLFEDLLAMCKDKEVIKGKIFCLEFPSGISTDNYFAIVLIDFDHAKRKTPHNKV